MWQRRIAAEQDDLIVRAAGRHVWHRREAMFGPDEYVQVDFYDAERLAPAEKRPQTNHEY
jgi:hypothetical protein